MKYLLDTNICIYLIKKKPLQVIARLKSQKISDVCISSITLSELEHGVEKSSLPIRNRMALNEFLSPIEICSFDNRAALFYGKIRVLLEKNGTPIGPLDTLIAAHCLSLNAILITNNEAEFNRIPGLKIENWVKL